uniref:hypothetical protein n=1 Tax=Prevotella sp. TaxID=59823 RepID=UPI00257F6D83
MKKKQVHKLNQFVTMLLLVMAILMPCGGAWAQTQPANGDGSVENPYQISTAAELLWFRNYVNKRNQSVSAKLTADIDLSEFCYAADSATNTEELSWTPMYKYQGIFDGNGKTISNLFIYESFLDTGFFGCVSDGCIKNITFDNAWVKSTLGPSVGILAGDAGSCIIENIKTLENCSVEGRNHVGGIAGSADGDIINCENHAMVTGGEIGGIAGRYGGSDNSITSCANYGALTGQEVGGLVGCFFSGTIRNCANYGNIMGTDRVGGLIGFTDITEIRSLNNVLSTGNVTATATSGVESVGLFVGDNSESAVTASDNLAYSSSAKLTINGKEQTGDAVKVAGYGSLTYPEGKNEADVVKAFTVDQLKSGEVAYLLNGSTSEGELAWYQKLGKDAYPVLTSAEGNKIYKGSFRYCDNTAASYSNTTIEGALVHKPSATLTSPEHDADEHIYHMGCCNEECSLHKYVADKAGNIEVIKDENSKFVAAEDLTLVDGEDFKDYEAFTSRTISYSRNIPTGSKWGTLCVPFAIDSSQETECIFYRLTGIDEAKQCITLESYEEAEIPAGSPVLFKMKEGETSLDLSASNAEIVTSPAEGTASNVSLVGSFTKIGGNDNKGLDDNDYIIGKDKFWRVSDLTNGKGVGIKPMHAYIHPANVSQARAAMLSIENGDGTTAIDTLNAISNDADAEYYDVSGLRTKGLQKGLNIVKHGSKTYKIMVR